MATLFIRDVSDDALTVIRMRAAQAHLSVQSYMRDLIEREAAVPTLAEAAAEAGRIAALNRSSGPITSADILDALDEGRAGR